MNDSNSRIVGRLAFALGVTSVAIAGCLAPDTGQVVPTELPDTKADASDVATDIATDTAVDTALPEVALDADAVETAVDTAADTAVVPDSVVAPPGSCCLGENQCAPDQQCARPSAAEPGVCLSDLPSGQCWEDAMCGAGEVCKGAAFCPCGLDCALAVTPGACEPLQGCCTDDLICGPNSVCAKRPGDTEGSCVFPPQPGACWDETHCDAGQACVGMSFCPCGFLCGAADTPGTCVDKPANCCFDDDECAPGKVCEGLGDTPGTCVDDPLGPGCLGDAACCWNAGDCGADAVCTGASPCGCVELCDGCGICDGPTMGYCQSGGAPCCDSDFECPANWACAGGPTGTCKPLPDTYGVCWSDSQCAQGDTCLGASTCPCDADCDGADEPGSCLPAP